MHFVTLGLDICGVGGFFLETDKGKLFYLKKQRN